MATNESGNSSIYRMSVQFRSISLPITSFAHVSFTRLVTFFTHLSYLFPFSSPFTYFHLHFLSYSPSLSPSLSFSPSFSASLPLSPSLPFSLSLSLPLSPSHSLSPSLPFSLSLPLSLSPSLPLSLTPLPILSLHLPFFQTRRRGCRCSSVSPTVPEVHLNPLSSYLLHLSSTYSVSTTFLLRPDPTASQLTVAASQQSHLMMTLNL